MSIYSFILFSILIISYFDRIYTEFIDGISIVDKHCRETTIDQNVCIQMAILRIWSTVCERKTIGLVTCDDHLQHFGKIIILNR
jgi:glucose-6-phosphate isomerase